jgi:hypothetical protein
MAALDEVKRRGDQVLADPRAPVELSGALIAGESGLWVGACAARWVLQSQIQLAPLFPALQTALHSPYAPLREAAALAVAQASPQEAPRLLSGLLTDAAASVSRTVRALLQRAPRAIA